MKKWYYLNGSNDLEASALASVLYGSLEQFNIVYTNTIFKYLYGLDNVNIGYPIKDNGDEVSLISIPDSSPFDIMCAMIAEQLHIQHSGNWKPYLGFVRDRNEVDLQLERLNNIVLFCEYLNERDASFVDGLDEVAKEIKLRNCTSICCGSKNEMLINGAYDFRELLEVDEIIKNKKRINAIVTSSNFIKAIGCLLDIPVVLLYTNVIVTYSNNKEYVTRTSENWCKKIAQNLINICYGNPLANDIVCGPNEKKFEVPYNFDEEILPYYYHYSAFINFLFLPPYYEDAINTRTCLQTNIKGNAYMPQTRGEYEYHINLINSINLRFVVLWQDRTQIISKEILEYYCRLGACGFIVANDQNAKIIKEYNSDLLVIASIVQRLVKDINKKDFQYYDYVVMFYPFNRSLDAIRYLEKIKDKIVVMPNSFCHTECQGVQHWFGEDFKHFELQKHCPAYKDREKCTFIYPEYLELFDDFVGGYKLQGREWPTDYLITVCESYFNRTTVPGLINNQLDVLLKRMIKEKTPYIYYNSQTQDIIDKV